MTGLPLRVLVIGTLPPPIGGAGVLLQCLVDSLARRQDVEAVVINTSGIRGQGLKGVLRLLPLVRRIFVETARVEVVSLHAAPTGLPLIGPVVAVCAKLRGKPLIVRMFGGTDYRKFDPVRRALSRWMAHRAKMYLVETKTLVQAAEAEGLSHVKWYPNSRPMEDTGALILERGRRCRNFVFISQVKRTKGIPEIIAAAERFGEDVCVDVYGPFFDDLSEKFFAGLERVRYRGVLPPAEVPGVLRRYHALLLPTYYEGEGYPGIIIESYAAGLPVITTRWKNVPEIADDSCALLIEPRNAEALYLAMKALMEDDVLYARLCAGARSKRQFFDAQTWTEQFVMWCKSLVREPR